jgi:hypothetical protein
MEVLNDLGSAVEGHLRESRPASPAGSVVGLPHTKTTNAARAHLATLYAFAEREALIRLCKAVDEVSNG